MDWGRALPVLSFQSRRVRGFTGIRLPRGARGEEVECVTIVLFDSLDAVRESVGEDYEPAVVPEKAKAMLSRFDERSQHHEVKAAKGVEG